MSCRVGGEKRYITIKIGSHNTDIFTAGRMIFGRQRRVWPYHLESLNPKSEKDRRYSLIAANSRWDIFLGGAKAKSINVGIGR